MNVSERLAASAVVPVVVLDGDRGLQDRLAGYIAIRDLHETLRHGTDTEKL